VLESAFTSARDMAPRVAPWLPFATRFMRSRFDTLGAARAVTVPKLVIHGADDPVTPFEMGETLYEQVSEPKRFLAVPGAQHTDTWLRGDRDYLESVREFIDRSVP